MRRRRRLPEVDVNIESHSLRLLEEMLLAADLECEREELLRKLEEDPRKGAKQLVAKARRETEKARQQESRWRAFCDPELQLQEKGYNLVAGVDEAGCGPLAGPVVVAAVILPPGFVHHPLDDSKRMTATARQIACKEIKNAAIGWRTGVASVEEIDRHNILGAVHLAVNRALTSIDPLPLFALVDGRPLASCPVPHRAIVGGDGRCRVIAAASVVAKVERDAIMTELDFKYPGYGLASHKGYATAGHYRALEELGPSPVHRRTFLKKSEQLTLDVLDVNESPQEWGVRAENMVAADYSSRGYHVADRRWRGGGGELDLVCLSRDEIIMVEVKAARSQRAGSPLEWLSEAQRRRWRTAAAAYLRESGSEYRERSLRFDLVGVVDRSGAPPELTRIEGVEP